MSGLLGNRDASPQSSTPTPPPSLPLAQAAAQAAGTTAGSFVGDRVTPMQLLNAAKPGAKGTVEGLTLAQRTGRPGGWWEGTSKVNVKPDAHGLY